MLGYRYQHLFCIFIYILNGDRFFSIISRCVLLVFITVLDFVAVLYMGKKHEENNFTRSFQESKKSSLCFPGHGPRSLQLGALSLHNCCSYLYIYKKCIYQDLSLYGELVMLSIPKQRYKKPHSQRYCVYSCWIIKILLMLDHKNTPQAILQEVKHTWYSCPHTDILSQPFSLVKTKRSLPETSFYNPK